MKKVVITGVSRGIGKAAAKRFLTAGWSVIGTSRKLVEMPEVEWVELDLASGSSREYAADTIQWAGPFDVLINNAGMLPFSERNFGASRIRESELRETLEVNLIGTIDLTEQLISNIRRSGQIILLGSMCGSLVEANCARSPMYSISKAALHMYGRQLASRLKDRVTVSVLDPGWVKTDMGGPNAEREPSEAAEELYRLATAKVPTGRFWKNGKERPW